MSLRPRISEEAPHLPILKSLNLYFCQHNPFDFWLLNAMRWAEWIRVNLISEVEIYGFLVFHFAMLILIPFSIPGSNKWIKMEMDWFNHSNWIGISPDFHQKEITYQKILLLLLQKWSFNKILRGNPSEIHWINNVLTEIEQQIKIGSIIPNFLIK